MPSGNPLAPLGRRAAWRPHVGGGFTATLLKDGRVLIVGGLGGKTVVASAELYDPAAERFSSAGAMSCPRMGHTATLLTDGQVLIAGGSYGCDPSAELYNPSTGTFTPTGSMLDGNQGAHSAILLKDGRVLISGGVLYPSGIGQTAPSLYDPATGMFTPAGDLNGTRNASTATLLDDGRALLLGGWKNGDVSVYDPVSGNWMFLGNLPIWSHTSTLLSNGTVLIIGGLFFTGSDAYNDYGVEALSTSQIYDPHDLLFRATGSLLQARDGHTATLLPSGRVLVTGGDWNYRRILASAELYDPIAGGFADEGEMTVNRAGHTATLLRDGRVLLAGGDDLGTAELYVPPASALWQQALIAMRIAAGTDSLNFWQWAWYWQYLPAFPGSPVGFGVVDSISPGVMEQIIVAGGGDGFRLISTEQWGFYYLRAICAACWDY